MKEKTILGFDLGHSQTAVVKAYSNKPNDFKQLPLFNKPVLPTAILRRYKENGEKKKAVDFDLFIGDRAIKRLKADDEFFISFKKRPDNDEKFQQNMRDFFFEILQNLENEGHVTNWENLEIVLGCPSGWNTEEMRGYEKLLTNDRFPTPTVQKESRAALLHAIEHGAEMTQKEIKNGVVLVIDPGSSTLDFTLIFSGSGKAEALEDFGDDLGASMIEEKILAYSIEKQPQADVITEALELNPSIRNKVLYKCRGAKEEYFSDPDAYEEEMVPVYSESVATGIDFLPQINGEIMRQILNQPINDLGQTWPERFEELVKKAHDKISESDYPLKGIVITGGASRMGFVKEIVTKVFSNYKDIKFAHDPMPEYSVAQGLARWGRREYLIDSFKNEIDKIFISDVSPLVEKHFEKLIDLLFPALIDKVIDEFAVPEIIRWKNNENGLETILDLNNQIQQKTTAWLESHEGQDFTMMIANQWWRILLKELNPMLEPVCKSHDLEIGSLNLGFPFKSNDDSYSVDIPVPIPMESILRMVGYVIFWAIVWVLPLGGPIIAVFITLFFKDGVDNFIDDQMRVASIWPFMRKTISDSTILSIKEKQSEKIFLNMKEAVLCNEEAKRDMSDQLVDALNNVFIQKAEEASLLIK